MDTPIMPLAGINNVGEDAALQGERLFVRDALNVNVTQAGKAEVRPGARLVTAQRYRNLWQSPLHGDTFATLGADWVKVDPSTWLHRVLAAVGEAVGRAAGWL